jgi:hypothetical protein
MAFMIATATYHSTYSVVGTCWPPSCGEQISMGRQARRWPHSQPLAARAHPSACRQRLCAGRADDLVRGHGVDFVLGLAKNDRLIAEIKSELAKAEKKSRRTNKPARYFKDFKWKTPASWHRQRRVVAKAEFTQDAANPRFILAVTLRMQVPVSLRKGLLCSRRHGEPYQGVPTRSLCRPHDCHHPR